MARSKKPSVGSEKVPEAGRQRVTLRTVAEEVGLSTATVSLVLNSAPGASAIPPETHARVIAAANALNYRPNHLARALRQQRSSSVGVLLPEIIDGYATVVLGGIESQLIAEGYFFLVASHRSQPERLHEYLEMLRSRLVEGLLCINTQLHEPPGLPAVAVSGHSELPGIANVAVDHDVAARLALEHLAELGHRRIAVFKGHPGSADTEDRWRAIASTAATLGLEIDPELVLQLSGDPTNEVFTPEEGFQEGYVFGRKLLSRNRPFTALFAFNDVSAIGAIRAFSDGGFEVPREISVVGFDDIQSAAFHIPRLTTVRQPLTQMGATAARLLLEAIRSGARTVEPPLVTVAPSLVVRESTAPPPS